MQLDLPSSITTASSLDSADLRMSRLRALRGPNFWRLSPVIACDVSLGTLEGVTTDRLDGFSRQLLELLPTLEQHGCSAGGPGGFAAQVTSGTRLPHVLEHVAIELQSLAGPQVGFGRSLQSGDEEVWWVIVAYEEEELGLAAMAEAVRLVQACIDGVSYDIRRVVRDLRDRYDEARLGPSTAAIVEEARRRNIPVRRLNSSSLVQLGLGANLRRIQAAMSDFTSAIAVDIAQDKHETRRVLEGIGLPVPEGRATRDLEDAARAASDIGYPVVLKPLDGSKGRGFSGGLPDEAALRRAWPRCAGSSEQMVVEKFVEGRDYRVLVVGGQFVAVAERIPARVVGDGRRTVKQLIAGTNQDPRRGSGHERQLTRIAADEGVMDHLAGQGMGLESVPVTGQIVSVCATPNLSTGGTAIDRSDEIHPDNITACELAAGVVGLDIAGIDVVTPDISVPFRQNGARIIELNAAPGLRMHTHPCEGTPRNVAAPIVDMLYPPGTRSRIPVIAVTGTNGKTTTVRLLAHLFRARGKRVGFTTTDGLYIGNRLVMEGDMTGPFSANIILSNPTVEVAVLETARGGLLRGGLGFDDADVGIVLNVSSDHLGSDGIHTLAQLAAVKAVVPAVVMREGHAILNADDPLVLAMREKTTADVVLISTREAGENLDFEEHVERGGIGARIEKGAFVIRRGRLRIPIAAAADVPLMLGGAARFQAENVLAAIAAAYVQEVRYDDIRSGLLSFFPSPAMTPGRVNLLRVGNAHVLVDYAHNSAAVAAIVALSGALPARRRIGVVTVPGDRRDEDLRDVGRIAARLDHVILKEDADRRGRPEGEIARLILEGMREAGGDGRHEVVLREADAVERVLSTLEDGDLAIVLAENVGAVLAQIRPRVSNATFA
ncbi:MAG: cyanophycin synthetase [Gemmatimonadota bacterium]